MRKTKELLREGDVVQVSEKLYKVAEECIKAMAKLLSFEEAKEKGRWTLKLLDAAARKLAEKVDAVVLHSWDHAYFLHVESFHEARLGLEQVEARMKYIEELLHIAKKLMQTRRENGDC